MTNIGLICGIVTEHHAIYMYVRMMYSRTRWINIRFSFVKGPTFLHRLAQRLATGMKLKIGKGVSGLAIMIKLQFWCEFKRIPVMLSATILSLDLYLHFFDELVPDFEETAFLSRSESCL